MSRLSRVILSFGAFLAFFYYVPSYAYSIAATNALRPSVIVFGEPTSSKILHAAMDAGLPPHIALDRFWRESHWIHAVHGQVVRSNGQDCGIAQLRERFNPEACWMTEDESIHEGVRQLAMYWKLFHNERLTRIAYTSGLGVARRKARR